jgi:1-acyl-sn-glycerol-3-phosphate acyltransferase
MDRFVWSEIPRFLFVAFLVRPVMLLAVGLSVRNREGLPAEGPAIIAANHNSHADTLALMSLFPLRHLHRVRAVAADDHFREGTLIGWIARNLLGILPIRRTGAKKGADPLVPVIGALDDGAILIIYPEGTRGEPEQLQSFKRGIAHLRQRRPGVPVVPVFLQGFGKVLPRGSWVPVPFFCDVVIGEPLGETTDRNAMMADLEGAIAALADQVPDTVWE